MSLQNPYILGAFMVAAGLFLWLAARLVLNRFILERTTSKISLEDSSGDPNQQQEAVLLIRHGGRLAWLNARARELFQIKSGDEPSLEQLAQKTRSGDDFLRLCARDGQTRFVLNGKTLEASTHTLCFQDESYRLVALREAHPEFKLTASGEQTQARTTLQDISNLALLFSTNLELDNVLRTICDNLERLLPFDVLEIGLWEADSQQLDFYQMRTAPGGGSKLKKVQPLSLPAPGLSGRLANERKALLLDDLDSRQEYQPAFEQSGLKVHACLGVSMAASGEFVGTLAMGSCEQSRYQTSDLELFRLIADHAAVALRNAQQFQQVQRRALELNGLAQLTQAFGSIRDPHQLYVHLVTSIEPLVPASILGFLIYNENTRMLEGRAPFTGLPAEFVEMYRILIPGGSLLERVYLAQEVIHSPNAAGDARWEELGLHPLAAAASLRETVLMPLVSGGKMLGYLQAANRTSGGSDFSEDELRLIGILASQTAPIIENANMLQQLSLRAERAETLRRIATLASSAAPLEDILLSSMEELVRLLHADYAAVFMVDKNRTIMQLQRSASCGNYNGIPAGLTCLRLEDVQFPFTAAGSLQILCSGKTIPEKPLVPFYYQMMNALQVESLVAAPLVVNGEGIAEIWVCSREPEFFDASDIQAIGSAAGQLAGLVENVLADRTEELRREHNRLQTMLRISTELSASLDIQQVLMRSLAVINEAFGAQASVIFTAANGAVFRAGELFVSSEEDHYAEEGSLEWQVDRWLAQNRVPLLVDCMTVDDRWCLSPRQMPAVNSLLGIPLILGEEMLGSLLLLHASPAFFHSEQIDLLAAIARQIAGTLKNSELFNLIRDQAENLGSMLREQQIEASRSRAILEAVADGVVVTGAEGQITLFNEAAGWILGMPVQQMVGQTLDQIASLAGKADREWLDTIRGWTQGGASEGHTYAAQINLDNGRVVEIHLAPVIWRGSFLGTVSIFHDVTHQVQVDRLKSEFITNVSHELRTPLTSIKGYADILLMGAAGGLSEQQTHFIHVIRENALRLQELVDDLLDVSHIQAGQITLEFQAIDLAEIAIAVSSELRQISRRENKPISVTVDVQPGLPCARGDPARTKQVLLSLAENGFKYTPENGEVIIRVRRSGVDELQVDVKDNGIGIPLEDQPHIFDRFFRGEHPLIMAAAGAGLGLALAKILVEMQGGRIWFESKGIAGEGSVFSFTIPVERAEG